MILKSLPQKKKDEFELIGDIRVIKEVTETGNNHFIYEFPQLPAKFNKFYHSKQEKINLFTFTCTCEQFRNNSKLYKGRDIRKACKHIYYKASAEWLKNTIDPITLLLLKIAVFNGYKHLYKVYIYVKNFYFIINPESAWVKIITLTEMNSSIEYHYHTINRRWGFSLVPENEVFVVDQIQKIIKHQFPVDHPYKKFSELEKY